MNLRLRRTLFIATTTLLLAAPLRLVVQAAEPAYVPIDPDLPKPGPVIAEVFGTWTPLLGNALLVAEAPVSHERGSRSDRRAANRYNGLTFTASDAADSASRRAPMMRRLAAP